MPLSGRESVLDAPATLRQAGCVPSPEHPMLPYVLDLELHFDPKAHRAYDPVELVRYALTISDYWADLALKWLDQGVPTERLKQDLHSFEAQENRPQSLRHVARRLRRTNERTH